MKTTHNQEELKPFQNRIDMLNTLYHHSICFARSENYMKLINFIARSRTIAPFNAMMLFNQNPKLTLVKTRSDWALLGRTVIPDRRAYVILRCFGPIDYVYDYNDTEGKDLPDLFLDPFQTSGRSVDPELQNTIKSCQENSIIVSFKPLSFDYAGNVAFDKSEQSVTITINSFLKTNERFSTLIHELAHLFCGHTDFIHESILNCRTRLPKPVREIEAESVAFLVCKRLGLEPASHSYLAAYMQHGDFIPNESFGFILNAAEIIEKMLNNQPAIKSKRKRPRKTAPPHLALYDDWFDNVVNYF